MVTYNAVKVDIAFCINMQSTLSCVLSSVLSLHVTMSTVCSSSQCMFPKVFHSVVCHYANFFLLTISCRITISFFFSHIVYTSFFKSNISCSMRAYLFRSYLVLCYLFQKFGKLRQLNCRELVMLFPVAH